jgi:hypothetical protein
MILTMPLLRTRKSGMSAYAAVLHSVRMRSWTATAAMTTLLALGYPPSAAGSPCPTKVEGIMSMLTSKASLKCAWVDEESYAARCVAVLAQLGGPELVPRIWKAFEQTEEWGCSEKLAERELQVMLALDTNATVRLLDQYLYHSGPDRYRATLRMMRKVRAPQFRPLFAEAVARESAFACATRAPQLETEMKIVAPGLAELGWREAEPILRPAMAIASCKVRLWLTDVRGEQAGAVLRFLQATAPRGMPDREELTALLANDDMRTTSAIEQLAIHVILDYPESVAGDLRPEAVRVLSLRDSDAARAALREYERRIAQAEREAEESRKQERRKENAPFVALLALASVLGAVHLWAWRHRASKPDVHSSFAGAGTGVFAGSALLSLIGLHWPEFYRYQEMFGTGCSGFGCGLEKIFDLLFVGAWIGIVIVIFGSGYLGFRARNNPVVYCGVGVAQILWPLWAIAHLWQ